MKQITIFIKQQSQMQSKNTADYTDFNGKTFKKIVQAPGGTSTFSLGWGNDKVDYGSQKIGKRKDNWNKPTEKNFNQTRSTVDEPIRVMQEMQQVGSYGAQQSNFKKNSNNIQSGISRTPLYPTEINAHRTCVKIHEQKTSIVLGDDNYNYWEELRKQKGIVDKKQRQSKIRTQQQQPQEKTSVKVTNPSGGKSSFIFG